MYKPEKAAAMACFFLEKAKDRSLNDIKLMKLLYIAERESLKRLTATITGSRFSSMKHGPVLSDAYRNLRAEWQNQLFEDHIAYLEHKKGEAAENTFRLKAPLDPKEFLSKAELDILESVWKVFGQMDKWTLRALTHEFPEWDSSVAKNNAEVRSTPLPLFTIFEKALDHDPEAAQAKADEIEYYEAVSA